MTNDWLHNALQTTYVYINKLSENVKFYNWTIINYSDICICWRQKRFRDHNRKNINVMKWQNVSFLFFNKIINTIIWIILSMLKLKLCFFLRAVSINEPIKRSLGNFQAPAQTQWKVRIPTSWGLADRGGSIFYIFCVVINFCFYFSNLKLILLFNMWFLLCW